MCGLMKVYMKIVFNFHQTFWGIVGDWLIEPIFLLGRLVGEVYRYFFEESFPESVKDVLFTTKNIMCFMHDDAPVHFSMIARF